MARAIDGLPYTAMDLAIDLGASEATVKRRLSAAGVGLLSLVRGRDMDTGPMTSSHTLADDVPTFDARATGFPCPGGPDGDVHHVRRLVENGTRPRYCADHQPTAEPTRMVPRVTLVVCCVCGGRIPLGEAAGFFRADRPDPVRFVHRADVTSACFRRAILRAATEPEALAA